MPYRGSRWVCPSLLQGHMEGSVAQRGGGNPSAGKSVRIAWAVLTPLPRLSSKSYPSPTANSHSVEPGRGNQSIPPIWHRD